ncbi:MAG: phage holin family protein [Candidatus Eremiobacteraeota bacterium]|nr:phage holin family protein [Candidatus Eremiobacteraeota bacterium]
MDDRNDNQGDSFPEQLKQFAGDIAVIVREDLRSAVDEMTEKAKTAGVGAGMLSGSALTALMTLFSLTALVMIALALAMPAWLAALIVTLLWAIATAALALMGKRKIQEAGPPIPQQTIENVKEDLRAAREIRR